METISGVAAQAAMEEATGKSDTSIRLVCKGIGTIGWMTTFIQTLVLCLRRPPARICQCTTPQHRSRLHRHQLFYYPEYGKIVQEILILLILVIVQVNLTV